MAFINVTLNVNVNVCTNIAKQTREKRCKLALIIGDAYKRQASQTHSLFKSG